MRFDLIFKEVRFERSSIRDDPRKHINVNTLSRYAMFESTIFQRININFTFLLARAGFYPYIPGVTTSIVNATDPLRPGEVASALEGGDGFEDEAGGANNQASASGTAPAGGPQQQLPATTGNQMPLGLPPAAARTRRVPYPRPPGRLLEPFPADTVVCAFCKRFFWNWFAPTEIGFDPSTPRIAFALRMHVLIVNTITYKYSRTLLQYSYVHYGYTVYSVQYLSDSVQCTMYRARSLVWKTHREMYSNE